MAKQQKRERFECEMDNLELIKQSLLRHAAQCGHLAERLSEKGDALTKDERSLIRVAMVPVVDEMYFEMKMAYLAGAPVGVVVDELAGIRGFIQEYCE